MPPGFVCILKTTQISDIKHAALELEQLVFPNDLFEKTSLTDFNHLLFRCE
jgi:hypothetical protein